MSQVLTCKRACLLLCLVPVWVQAMPWMEELKGIGDPTRPPYGAAMGKGGALPIEGAASDAAAAKPKVKPVGLKLQGIRYDAARGHGVAMINDEIVEVGDSVSGMKVVSISAQMAVLKGPGGVRKLRLLVDPEEPAPEPQAEPKADAKASPASHDTKAPTEGATDKQPVPDKGQDETAKGGRKEDQ